MSFLEVLTAAQHLVSVSHKLLGTEHAVTQVVQAFREIAEIDSIQAKKLLETATLSQSHADKRTKIHMAANEFDQAAMKEILAYKKQQSKWLGGVDKEIEILITSMTRFIQAAVCYKLLKDIPSLQISIASACALFYDHYVTLKEQWKFKVGNENRSFHSDLSDELQQLQSLKLEEQNLKQLCQSLEIEPWHESLSYNRSADTEIEYFDLGFTREVNYHVINKDDLKIPSWFRSKEVVTSILNPKE